MRLLYSLLYAVALAFVFPFEYKKRPEGIRKRWLDEKMGHVPLGATGPCIWVHAVSVGEVIAAETFIKALKEKHPKLRIVVSTITDTGQAVARERLKGLAEAVYMPFDLVFILRRAISRLRPFLFIIMETELWPNAIWSMQSAGVPVLMLNGRVSEGSFKGYRKIKFFIRRVLKAVNVFCMQDEEYAGRMTELGAPRSRVKVTGSFKFDLSLPDRKPDWGELLKGPVIVAGSTHRGEEQMLISVYERLKTKVEDLTLIIAPRHPERFDEVEGLLKEKWLKYVRRSKLEESGISGMIVILDTIGELSGVYSLADVAVIGGSFVEHGGQNPLEPAYWGKPVVCGPHMENFPFIEDFYSSGAAVLSSRETLYDVLRDLVSSPEKCKSIGGAAAELLKKNQGAVERAIEVVERYLKR
jgi:3-deoxy-D-manno-octulosonic-acid transferase